MIKIDAAVRATEYNFVKTQKGTSLETPSRLCRLAVLKKRGFLAHEPSAGPGISAAKFLKLGHSPSDSEKF
ncbi:MAG: hypothetical protein ACQERN_09175 [Thermodesulfobacteriota bacterium]